jgi:Protein of unknown function (DUF3467)
MEGKTPGDFPDPLREGRYANFFNIGFNAFEVVLEFGQFFEGNAKPNMHTRILMSPVYARSLCSLLQASLEKYEAGFGEIPSGGFHE